VAASQPEERQVAEQPTEYSAPQRGPGEFRFSDLRFVGQVLNCYLVCELNEMLVMVDMHAAHERVNYNRIRKARAERALTVQKLLIPEQVKLTPEQVATLLDQGEALKALAFEVRQASADTIEVLGVPGIVSHLRCSGLLKEFAVEPVVAGWRERLEERIDHMAARIACHASVRSGDAMSRPEAYALFQQMDESELSGACPHGRPVVAQFSRDAVERWFGRDR
jgi:DNA mismatch repair protein MutL